MRELLLMTFLICLFSISLVFAQVIIADDLEPGMQINVYWRVINADRSSERENLFQEYFIVETKESLIGGKGIVRGQQIIDYFLENKPGLHISDITMLNLKEDTPPEKIRSRQRLTPDSNCNMYIYKYNDEPSIFVDVEVIKEYLKENEKINIYTRKINADNLYLARSQDEHQKAGYIIADKSFYGGGNISSRLIIDFVSKDEAPDGVKIINIETSQEATGFLSAVISNTHSFNGFIVHRDGEKSIFVDMIYLNE